MKNNRGFSLVELIIVVAIMAVLVGIIAPTYMKYVSISKRNTDVANAEKIVEVMNVLLVTEGANVYIPGVGYVTGHAWNKDSLIGDGSDVYSRMFQTMGEVPISQFDGDLFWLMTFAMGEYGYLEVKSIYLAEFPGASMGYELYPDASAFLNDGIMVSLTSP